MTPAQKAEAIGALYAPATSAIADCVRAFVTAPKGRDLIAVDYAAVEARGVQWLAGNDKVLDAFRAGDSDPTKPDAYMDAASDLFGDPVTSKKDPRRPIGKVNVLSLGFQGGVAAQAKMAQTYNVDMGLAYEPLMAVATPGQIAAAEKACKQKLRQFPKMTREFFIASDIAKQRWRANNAPVVEYWRDLGDAAINAVLQPGGVQTVGPEGREIRFKKSGSFLWMRLPSGRAMCYPYPEIRKRPVPWGTEIQLACETEDRAIETYGKDLLGYENGIATVLQPEFKNALTYMADKKDMGGWVRVSSYGGSLCENCLAGGTEVLTDGGWVALIDVNTSHRVWDGGKFVAHDGLIYRGVQHTIGFSGARMTPDHRVLTHGGWRAAGAACESELRRASPRYRLNRSTLGTPSGGTLPRIGEQDEVAVACAVRLRNREDDGRERIPQRQDAIVWMLSEGDGVQSTPDARKVKYQVIRRVAQYARPLPAAEPQGVSEVRRSWNFRSRALEFVLKFLQGCTPDLRRGLDFGSPGQWRPVLAEQFSMGYAPNSSAQYAFESGNGHPARKNARLRSVGEERHRRDNAAIPAERRLAGSPSVRRARLFSEGDGLEPVYDILNAGPRHCFTVRGANGIPFIVSNCTQAVCRDLLWEAMPRLEAAGYEIVFHNYDEVMTEQDETFGSVEEVERLMCITSPWAAGFPVAAEGWRARRYRK